MEDSGVRFGALIRSARLAHNPPITQECLADALGVTQPSVSAWEKGKAFPAIGVLHDLAAVLDLNAGDLLDAAASRAVPA